MPSVGSIASVAWNASPELAIASPANRFRRNLTTWEMAPRSVVSENAAVRNRPSAAVPFAAIGKARIETPSAQTRRIIRRSGASRRGTSR
jgi:hypothetical protein